MNLHTQRPGYSRSSANVFMEKSYNKAGAWGPGTAFDPENELYKEDQTNPICCVKIHTPFD